MKNEYFRKFELNKKVIVIIVLLVVIAVTAVAGKNISDKLLANKGLDETKYTILQSGSNINKVNYKGEVKCKDYTNVYSNLSLPVKEVKVELGDEVKAGDVLAILDTKTLEDEINKLQESINTTNSNNNVALDNAKKEYDIALNKTIEGKNDDIKEAEVSLRLAQLELEDKKKNYEKNEVLFNNNAISQKELDDSKLEYEKAEENVNKYIASIDNKKSEANDSLVEAKNAYETAKTKSQDKSQIVSLNILKKQLTDAIIKAPVDGIVSVKNVKVGDNAGSGLLFEIDNDNDTNVVVNVKEVNINKIEIGQKALVKTDSTGDDFIDGEVVNIKPIANIEDKDSLALNNDSNDKEAEFEVEIKITDPNYKLKIGMKAQADIIIAEEEGVFKVPIESIVKDKDNNDCLYIAEEKGDSYVVKQISITKGSETDTEVEVMGNDIKDGVVVLNNPEDFEIGSSINIKK